MLGRIAIAGSLALLPTLALADPCRAVNDQGWMPKGVTYGGTFSGPVVHVIDGDSFCVAIGDGQDRWVEVRLADFSAPELKAGGAKAKSTLERLAMGQQATCVAGAPSYDRVVSRCRINGRPVGDLMRAAGVKEGGNGGARGEPTWVGRLPVSRIPRTGSEPAPTSYGMSCAELRAKGGARRGEPGYRPEWDGDGDGIACEPYRRR